MPEKVIAWLAAGVVLLLFLAGLVGLVLCTSIYYGWTLQILWIWFVVPVFELKPLTLLQAAGIQLVVGHIWRSQPYKDDDWKNALRNLLLFPPITLGIGWLFRWVLG